jgi:hypothetical protein
MGDPRHNHQQGQAPAVLQLVVGPPQVPGRLPTLQQQVDLARCWQ